MNNIEKSIYVWSVGRGSGAGRAGHKHRRFLKVSIAVLALASVTASNAQTSWTGSASNDWTNPQNWTNGVPNGAIDTFITSSGLGANVYSGSFASTQDLTLTDTALNVYGLLTVNGNFTMSEVSGNAYLSASGAGAVANIGSSLSTISIDSGAYGPMIEASSTAALNFNSNTFNSNLGSWFYVYGASLMSFNAQTSVNFGSSITNSGGQVEFASPVVNLNAGADIVSYGGTVGMNDVSGVGTTNNWGSIELSGANLFAGGDFTTNWYINGAGSNLYFGYNEAQKALAPVTMTILSSTVYLTNSGLDVNGNLTNNNGLLQVGNYRYSAANGGAVNVTGSFETSNGASTTLECGNSTNVGGDFIVDTGGGVEVWGSTSLQVNGSIYVENGARLFAQDLLEQNGANWTDLGGATVAAAALHVSDGWLEINNESSVTTGSATFSAGSTPQTTYQLYIESGGLLEVTSLDLTMGGYASDWNSGVVKVDAGNLVIQDAASFVNGGLVNVLNGGVKNSSIYNNTVNGVINIAEGLDNFGTGHDSAYVNIGSGAQTNVNQSNVTNRQTAEMSTQGGATMNVNSGNITNQDSASFQVHDAGSVVTVTNGNYTNQDNATTNSWNNGALVVSGGNYLNKGTAQTEAEGGEIQVQGGNFTNQDSAVLRVGYGGAVQVSGGDFYNHGGSVLVGSQADSTGAINVLGDYVQDGAMAQTKVYGALTANNINVSAGTMGGPGAFTGNVNVTGSGVFNVGDPQVSHIVGDFNIGTGGTLVLNIDGAGGPGVGNDLLDVTGNLHLGGTLDLVIGPGYTPSGPFNLFEFGSYNGSFATVEETLANGSVVPLQGSLNFGTNGATYNATPEPCSIAVLGFGALNLLLRKRRCPAA